MPHSTLTQIAQQVPLCNIKGLAAHIGRLEADGYVKITRDEQHRPICATITPKGKDFLNAGGYKAQRRHTLAIWIRQEAWPAVKYIIAAIIGAIIDRMLVIYC